MPVDVMRFRRSLIVGIVGALLCGPAAGQALNGGSPSGGGAQVIEYGYPDQSIFVATLNADGQPDSPMTRLARTLMAQAGMQMRAKPYPASRLFKNLQDGTVNFSILVRGSSLAACCLLSEKPVYSTKLNIYHVGDKPPISYKEDLIGKEVITIRGYSYAGLLSFIQDPANRIVNHVAGDHMAAFKMLKSGRADYVVDYASAATDILKESPIAHLKFNPIDNLDIYLVLAKSYPDAEALMKRLEQIVGQLDVSDVLHGGSGVKTPAAPLGAGPS
jgi:polar amino acid transport system substrate-binding protein